METILPLQQKYLGILVGTKLSSFACSSLLVSAFGGYWAIQHLAEKNFGLAQYRCFYFVCLKTELWTSSCRNNIEESSTTVVGAPVVLIVEGHKRDGPEITEAVVQALLRLCVTRINTLINAVITFRENFTSITYEICNHEMSLECNKQVAAILLQKDQICSRGVRKPLLSHSV